MCNEKSKNKITSKQDIIKLFFKLYFIFKKKFKIDINKNINPIKPNSPKN